MNTSILYSCSSQRITIGRGFLVMFKSTVSPVKLARMPTTRQQNLGNNIRRGPEPLPSRTPQFRILQPRALPSRIPKFRIPQFRILQPRTLPSRIPLLWIPQSRTRILQPRTLPSRIPQLWIPQSRTRILQLRTLPSRIPLHPRIVLHQKGIESDPWLKLHKKCERSEFRCHQKAVVVSHSSLAVERKTINLNNVAENSWRNFDPERQRCYSRWGVAESQHH